MSSTAYSEAQLPTDMQAGWRRSYTRISWGAVLAGAAVAAATMVLLSLLGVALGASGIHLTQTAGRQLRRWCRALDHCQRDLVDGVRRLRRCPLVRHP